MIINHREIYQPSSKLVGVWNMNFIFQYVGNFIIPSDRGGETTNQIGEIYQPSRKLHINVATLQQWQSSTVISCHLSWFSISCGPAWQDSHSVVLPKSRGPGQEAQPFHFDGQATRLEKLRRDGDRVHPFLVPSSRHTQICWWFLFASFQLGKCISSIWGNRLREFPNDFCWGSLWSSNKIEYANPGHVQLSHNKNDHIPLKGATIPTQLGILVMMIGWSGSPWHIYFTGMSKVGGIHQNGNLLWEKLMSIHLNWRYP